MFNRTPVHHLQMTRQNSDANQRKREACVEAVMAEVEKVKRIGDGRLLKEISIQYIAEDLETTVSKVGLWFEQQTGKTIVAFFQEVGDTMPYHSLDPGIQKVINYIQEREAVTGEHLLVSHIANKSGYKRDTFKRIFQREMDMTYQEFLDRRKIDHAKALLADPAVPLGRIETICGVKPGGGLKTLFGRYGEEKTPDQYRALVLGLEL